MAMRTDPVVLAVMAHPDDAEMSAGGTLTLLSQAGAAVTIVICSLPDLPEVRIEESQAGARLMGAHARFLTGPAGKKTWQVCDFRPYELVAQLDRIVAELRPTMFFTHWSGDTHDDHVAVARAATATIRARPIDLYACEQPNQRTPVAPGMRLNTYVDISEVNDTRIASVRAHVSQTASKQWEEHLQARSRFHGERFGWQHAEAFECVFQVLRPQRDRS